MRMMMGCHLSQSMLATAAKHFTVALGGMKNVSASPDPKTYDTNNSAGKNVLTSRLIQISIQGSCVIQADGRYIK